MEVWSRSLQWFGCLKYCSVFDYFYLILNMTASIVNSSLFDLVFLFTRMFGYSWFIKFYIEMVVFAFSLSGLQVLSTFIKSKRNNCHGRFSKQLHYAANKKSDWKRETPAKSHKKPNHWMTLGKPYSSAPSQFQFLCCHFKLRVQSIYQSDNETESSLSEITKGKGQWNNLLSRPCKRKQAENNYFGYL